MPPLVRRLAVPCALALVAVGPAAADCGSAGYTYAGVQSTSNAFGIRARITVAGVPHVLGGHVAAWVGVGGPGEGPGGTDEWLQVGISAFPGDPAGDVYYEVARPGHAPTYAQVATGIDAGVARDVAVLETATRPGVWRVWVDGRPVGPPIALAGSNGGWRPIATVESWGGGHSVCNGFGYRFDGISVARGRGGAWAPLGASLPIRSGGYRVVHLSPTAFVAMSEPVSRTELRANP